MSEKKDELPPDPSIESTRQEIAELKLEIAIALAASDPVGEIQQHKETARRLFERADAILQGRPPHDEEEA